jgi:hypothetical protein
MTLEDQIKALEGMATTNAEQFKARCVIIATLCKLQIIRDSMIRGDSDGKVTNYLISACGLQSPPPGHGS